MIVLYQETDLTRIPLQCYDISSAATRNALKFGKQRLHMIHETLAAEVLDAYPFALAHDADRQETLLLARVSGAQYEQLQALPSEVFQSIAHVLQGFGCYVTAIAADCELAHEHGATPAEVEDAGEHSAESLRSPRALRAHEIDAVMYGYIGVRDGYLAKFNVASLDHFCRAYDVPGNLNSYTGSARSRFAAILRDAEPKVQARILQGVLDEFPAGSSLFRTEQREREILALIARLQGTAPVEPVQLTLTNEIVELALADAEILIEQRGATSGVDRVHTAFHGYLREACRIASISHERDATISELFAHLRDNHPAFAEDVVRGHDIRKIVRAFASVVDALGPLRNKASAAHANEVLLEPAEAMLVINAVRTLLHYIDSKMHLGAAM